MHNLLRKAPYFVIGDCFRYYVSSPFFFFQSTIRFKMFLKDFKDKVEKTERSRFAAYHRTRRCRIFSNVALAFFSFYIIVINSLVFLDPFKGQSDVITLVTIFMSTFILVLSLLVGQCQYESREMVFHECGKELTLLKDEIVLDMNEVEELSLGEKKDYLKRYHTILQKCSLNHEESDYLWGNRDINNCNAWLRFKYFVFDVNSLYLALIILTPLALYIWI